MSKLTAIALIPLLLLPSFLFLIPIAPVSAAPPSQPAGTSLPPGTVTASNTWNQTLTCPATESLSEPLVAQPDGWEATLRIPTLLFMGTPEGGYITQSFVLSRNGTFAVSDDYGNFFSFTVPMALSGVSTATIVGNSTTAVMETRVTAAAVQVADVKLTFSVYKEFCQPAGVRLEISGNENWGAAGRGTIRIVFDKSPLSSTGNRAWFGNRSGVALGFDWNDSRVLSPAFDAGTSTLSYHVGPTFNIDPVTVGTASLPFQSFGATCVANGEYWIFYFDGTHEGWRTSSDGLTWTSESTFTTSGYPSIGVGIYCNGNTLYYTMSGPSGNVYYRYGTMNSDGTISWSISEGRFQGSETSSATAYLTTTVDSNGNWWVAFRSALPGPVFNIEVWKCPSLCGVQYGWFKSTQIGNNEAGAFGKLVALTSGRLAIVMQLWTTYNSKLVAETYSGSAWSSAVETEDMYYNFAQGQCVAISDTVECASEQYPSSSGVVVYRSLSYNGSSPLWSSPSTLYTCSSGTDAYSSISTDATSDLVVYFSCSGSYTFFTESSDAGSSWASVVGIPSSGPNARWVTMSLSFRSDGLFQAIWLSGSSSPYNMMFVAVPYSTPTAALSTRAWSRPGLSPYESYFNEFSDYVSPGNGLVAVEAGTLSLPGRGLNFAPSLVYSEPYAFTTTGTPYLYDNYTGASLGYGWSLNFPWLGTKYLHLTDGQAYPYSWNGSTFQYNGVTDFVLTKNTGGTYTLNMSSGTLYRFDTSERLTSVTDRSGMNAITFSYGGNGYVSGATDTIGRTISFSYNVNNQLTSISSAAQAWTLAYSGAQLVSLTDPLSRVTSFYYNGTTGATAWLLNEVLWPTGGKVTYAYDNKPVGTEVSTYYVTLRNVYSGPSQLSLSQQIDSGLVDGRMVWSNSTISDGTAIREYLNYSFQSVPKSVMTVYAFDGTGALQRFTETDSDAYGRTNATIVYSPSGDRLAQSTFSYDDWGNMVYSNDSIGHEEWFSYANTDSQNSFASSGCSESFYTQTINSSIHDLLVGSCDFQNGPGSAQQETYFSYDRNGNLLATKVSHGGGWLYSNSTYDQYGNVLSSENADGATTYYRYSSTYSSAYLTKKSILVGTQNVTTTYAYDLSTGNILSTTDPNGQTTSYQYDALERVTQTTYPAVGGVSAHSYNYYYDGNDTMKAVDANGHVTKEWFDGLARETKVQRWNGTSAYSTESYTYNWVDQVATKTTATDNTYTYSYDWAGRLVRLTNPDSTYQTTTYNDVSNTKTVTDENGHQTVYAYDWDQRLISVKQYNSSSTYFLTTYSYDLSGNMLSATDAKSQTTSYTYDDLNRLTQTAFPTSPATTEARTYDNVGNLLTLRTANMSAGQSVSYAYDALNRLTTVTYPGSGGTVAYTYDQDGNRKSMINPSARDYYSYDNRDRLTNMTEYVGGAKYQTLYSYDAVGDITQLTYPDGYALSMTYDGVNRLKTVGSFATVSYTVDDRVNKITYGNGEVQTYTYDSRDRPTQIQDVYGGVKKMSLNYTYDRTGNVLNLNTETYAYDWLNRLNYSSGPWTTVTYSYDQVGNRVRMVQGSTTTYAYGPFNRLTSAGSTTYTYDSNGNMITKTGGWTYSYDYANRLTKVAQSGTTKQLNSYDGDGSKVAQTTASSTYTYSYAGLSVLYEKNVTSGTTTVTKHFYADGLQVAKLVGASTYYLHEDALGSTRLVTTASVTITFSSNYVPYGQNYAVSGKEVFMYTGEPYSSVTGLYYFGARYYDDSIGRFITQDSFSGSRTDPLSMNRYIYARDNPERYVDHSGNVYIDENGVLYVASGTALRAAGVITTTTTATATPTPTPTSTASTPTTTSTSTAATTTSSCTVSPDVCLTQQGDYQYSTPAPPSGSPDVTLTQQGLNQYANEPTIGVGEPIGAEMIVYTGTRVTVELNPDEAAGLEKMSHGGATLAWGLYQTVGGVVGGISAVLASGKDPAALAELPLSERDFVNGVQDTYSGGGEFLSGIEQFTNGMFSGLRF